MGVDYYTCDVCSEVYCDCGYCGLCEECSAGLCGDCYDKAIDKYGKDDDGQLNACQICSQDVISDKEVLNFMLKKYDVSRADIETEIKVTP